MNDLCALPHRPSARTNPRRFIISPKNGGDCSLYAEVSESVGGFGFGGTTFPPLVKSNA